MIFLNWKVRVFLLGREDITGYNVRGLLGQA